MWVQVGPKVPLFPSHLGNLYLHFPALKRGKAAWVSSFGVLGAGWWLSILATSGWGALKQGWGAETVTPCVLLARPASALERFHHGNHLFLPLSATEQRWRVSRGR